MSQAKRNDGSWAENQARNTKQLAMWTGAWVATIAIAAFGPKLVWDYNPVLSIVAVLASLGVGFGMVRVNGHYLQGLDELQRRIFLEAAALTLGVGLVCGLAYDLLDDIKLITFNPEISHLVVLMSLTFMGGLIAGQRKYQ